MARLILNQGDSVGLSAGNFDPVAGTVAGAETVTITGGTYKFDPSFNAGGDTIRLAGAPGDYTVRLSGGSTAVLTNGAGITVEIPVGVVGLNVVFMNGAGAGDDDSRSLVFDTVDSRVELGGVQVTATAAAVPGPATPPPALPEITVSNPVITEGNNGTSVVTFTLELSAATATAVVANFATQAGTASENNDFVASAGTVTFAPGQTVAVVAVQVVGDTVPESAEAFRLNLTSSQATIRAGGGNATIVDNDTQTTLMAGQDVLNGGPNDDVFSASNRTLNAGDTINGNAGNDTLNLGIDATAAPILGGPIDYSGFTLNSVENFVVTNDSGRTATFDLSGSTGLNRLVSSNSSDAIAFNQVPTLATTVEVENLTNTGGATADVIVQYQDAAVSNANDTATVRLSNSTADLVRIGRVSDNDGGLETVNLDVVGVSATRITTLDTDLTNLIITGSQSLTVTDALNQPASNVNAQASTGALTLSTANSVGGQAVSVTGSQGVNTLTGGAGNESVTTFAASDTINVAGGNNTVSAGAGNNAVTGANGVNNVTTLGGDDTITLGNGGNTVNAGDGTNRVTVGSGIDTVTTGVGNDAIFTGGGDDNVVSGDGADFVNISAGGQVVLNAGSGSDTVFGGAAFDASTFPGPDVQDSLSFGAGDRDVLQVTASANDAQFRNVNGLEVLTLVAGGTTANLNNGNGINGDSFAEAAGIDTINLSGGNDVVNAADFVRGLTFNATVTTAAGALAAGVTSNDFNPASGGSDTATGGLGDDVFNSFGTMDNSDALNGNVGSDTLNLDGSTTLNTTSLFSAIETINLQSSRDGTGTALGNVYTLTLDDSNAPTLNGMLTVDGNTLAAAVPGLNAESVFLSTTAVGVFDSKITTGAADDTVLTGTKNHTVSTGAGNDSVQSVGLATAGRVDTIDTGTGNDSVSLGATGGTSKVSTGDGEDVVFLTGLGVTELLDLGADNDFFDLAFNGNVVSDAAGDDVDGGSGTNTASVFNSPVVGTDAFAAIRNVQQLLNDGPASTITLGSQGELAGVVTIIDADDGSASTYDASGYIATDLTVDLQGRTVTTGNVALGGAGGGDDIVRTGGGNDTVLLGTGNNNIALGLGNDNVRAQATELNELDAIAGGAGTDTVFLDNSVAMGGSNAVTATVNLNIVTGVEAFTIAASGEQNTSLIDADASTLTFRNGNIGSLTTTTISAAALTDTDDSFRVVLDASLFDADYAFTLLGGGAGVDVVFEKRNNFTNNNIDFRGSASDDTLRLLANDLGSTTKFSGGSGTDTIEGTGGFFTDDGFAQVDGIEVLGAAAGAALLANLGSEAARSGLQTIRGSNFADNVTFDAGYANGVNIVLGGAGDDVFNASASAAAFVFNANAAELTSKDFLTGGSGQNDLLNIALSASVSSVITNVTGIERVVVQDSDNGGQSVLTLTLDTATAEVNGGVQTIDSTDLDDTLAGDVDSLVLLASAASAALVVNSGNGDDVITTGSGNDQVNSGAGNNRVTTGTGQDTVTIVGNGNNGVVLGDGNNATLDATNTATITGDGTNVIYGDTSADSITVSGTGRSFVAAGGGADNVTTGSGNDLISGGAGIDTINAGSGSDSVWGGAGADLITLGAGADTLVFGRITDSATSANRDIVSDFVSGTDKIDVRGILNAAGVQFGNGTLAFVGNFSSFGQAQGAIQAGGDIEAVYQADENTLWFDLDNNGQLDGNDLQLVLTGVNSVAASDIVGIGGSLNAGSAAGDFTTAFDTASLANLGFASNINYY